MEATRSGVMRITVRVIIALVGCAGLFFAFWPSLRASRILLTEESPACEVTLLPGKAVVISLPGDRELAVWNEKPGRFSLPVIFDGVSMGYGEKPFRQLDRFEEIQLPGGGSTRGESLSYIRPGPVMDGGRGKPREYILFVDNHRIRLKQTQLMPEMRIRVTMEKADEDESFGPKGEIDHFLTYLKSEDSEKRRKGVANLAELLICGSTYAELRESEIIKALQAVASDPDQAVREVAAAKLCEAGDPQSILKELESIAQRGVTDEEAAWSLGRSMRYPAKTGNVESVYQRAVELTASARESERVLGASFLSGCPEHATAGPAIRHALGDPSAAVRAAAARGLDQVYGSNSAAAREHSITMLSDPSPEVVAGVLRSSIYVGKERLLPFAVVEPFLDHEDRNLRIAAIRALRFATGSAVERRLLPLTRVEDNEIRAEAAEALAGSTSPETILRFVELLDDPDVIVRIRGIQGLSSDGKLMRPDAIHECLRNETDPDVIRVARGVLKEAD